MPYGIHGADLFAKEAGDVAGSVHGYRVERAHKTCLLRADGHTGSAVDAGIPPYAEENRLLLAHIFLYSEVGLK